jgi:large repetitive protein
VTYLVSYTNAEAITLTPGNVTLTATGDATGTVTVSGSGNAERTVSISNLAGNGTLGITIVAGTATSGGGAISATPSEPSATFIVDTTLPTLTVNTLADNTVFSDIHKTLSVSGSVSDSNQVATLTLTVNGETVTVPVTDGAFNTAVALQDGANTITVNATDGAGNLKSDTRTVIYDITAPIITFSAQTPTVNSITAQETVTISGSLNKPGSVKVGLHGGTAVDATMDGNNLNFTAQVTLALGPNTVDVTAFDTAKPKANESTVQRIVTFDSTKPALAIVDPAQDITTTLGSYLVKVTAADQYTALTLGISVDGVAVTPAPVLTDGSFQQSVSFTAGKTYAVSVTATDQAGNIATVQRNIIFRPLSIGDALRALQISVGLVQKTEQDSVLDVGPLLDGKPSPDGEIDISDAAVILRKVVGLVTW